MSEQEQQAHDAYYEQHGPVVNPVGGRTLWQAIYSSLYVQGFSPLRQEMEDTTEVLWELGFRIVAHPINETEP